MPAISIPVNTSFGISELRLFTSPNNYVKSEDANEYGEAMHQLYEGNEYEYRFEDSRLQFAENTCVHASPDESYPHGRIVTGNYVGTLHLPIKDSDDTIVGAIDFEIQSKKTSYRDDYRKMLSDITAYYTELVMIAGSPVSQKFEPDNEEDNRTVYQKFAFVKSIIESDEFGDAIHKILYNPVRRWTETTIERPITAVKKLNKNSIRQIATKGNRIDLPESLSIHTSITSVPRTITVPYKRDTIDTPENRFVKFVLESFLDFCQHLQDLKEARKNQHLMKEAAISCAKLENILNNVFFREIHKAQFVALNSPVLQKREGYREILQAWTMFDLAAKLCWNGGDNVYEAGKRNIATLYEYWLFFKLLEIVSSKFDLPTSEKSKLVHTDEDHINLALKQGRMIMVGGRYSHPTRNLNVRLFYNRTFSHNLKNNRSGSWTTAMRPDYTLSIWAGDISEKKAEEENAIVHIHFDAKYRVDQIQLLSKYDIETENLEEDQDTFDIEQEEELSREKEEQQCGTYKRADILKMHAYNDAIRRTGGSYILYPGTCNNTLRGFHEIIPGLGAFAVNPSTYEEDSIALKNFIDEIIDNFLNRISQREQIAYHDYKIHQSDFDFKIQESLPEPIGNNRDMIPTDVNVLLAYYKDLNHLSWILQNKKYNVRTGTGNGAILLTQEAMTAKYILLHQGAKSPQLLLKIKSGAKIYSGKDIVNKSMGTSTELYQPSKMDNFYLIFELEEVVPEEEFKDCRWSFSKMQEDGIVNKGHQSAEPKGISLATLMKYLVK